MLSKLSCMAAQHLVLTTKITTRLMRLDPYLVYDFERVPLGCLS